MPLPADSCLWLAYSGGLDSHVLLHAITHLALSQTVRAIHIHHGLQSIADTWVQHCQTMTQQLNIPLEIVYLNLKPSKGDSIEALARTGRYQAFSQYLQAGDFLLTAQHADDQAETLLLQLLRGASAAGLASMPLSRDLGQGTLLRPLLNCTQAELQAYAHQHQLNWIEDPSNQDQNFDRNYLRKTVMPLITKRWQAAVKSLGRAARHQAKHLELLEQLIQPYYQQCLLNQQRLSITELQNLTSTLQQQVLRFWIKQANLPMPNQARLFSLQQSLNSRSDRQLLLQWQQGEIRSYREALYIHRRLKPSQISDSPLIWSNIQQTLSLPVGQLSIKPDKHAFWQQLAPLEIRFRQGGERLQYYQQDKTLKHLLQKQAIVPWLRPYLPLVYQNNTLIAVVNSAVCDRLYHQDADCLTDLCWSID